MRKTLLQQYHQLSEAAGASTESDFPNLLGNTMHKKLLGRFNGFPSPWRQYTLPSDLNDFRKHDRVILSEAPDLLKITPDGPYKEAKFSDNKYQIQADTWGRTFHVSRRAVINDDLNGILKMPQMFGRSSVRTLVKTILFFLTGAQNSYDGSALFAVAHGNYGNTALANTTAGMQAVADGMAAMALATEPDSGELLGTRAKYLLTGVTLGSIARQLLRSAQILPASTTGGGTFNPIAGLEHIEEPLIDSELSTTAWFLLADPNDTPVIEVGFLDNKQEPDLLVMTPIMQSLAGGASDPWGYEFDDLSYKVRWDWGIQLAYYQGIYRGKA